MIGESCCEEPDAAVEALMAEVGTEVGCVLAVWEVWTLLGRGRRNNVWAAMIGVLEEETRGSTLVREGLLLLGDASMI